ncbi:unknown [Clostridium sp. CAG:813]|nr:unknown [Clostridium sp. CAG:813]
MEASFIKLNTNSFYDKKVLKTISEKWGGSFAEDIYIDATNVFEKDTTKGGIYAITTQKKGFTQVEPKKYLD